MGHKQSRRMISIFLDNVIGIMNRIEPAWIRQTNNIRLYRHNISYEGRPTDIYLVSYPKSGTTWMQMILYQLTTDGTMNFKNILEVIPHYENACIALDKNIFNDLSEPRIVKTHLSYRRIPKGSGRYIYVIRNGMDVCVSFYFHYRNFNKYRGSFAEFFELFINGNVDYGDWFRHVDGWVANRNNLTMLLVRYEDLVADLEHEIRKIAAFCGFNVADNELPRILDKSSFAFMRSHEEKLLGSRHLRKPYIVDGASDDTHFMRRGRIGDWRNHFTDDMIRRYADIFNRRLQRRHAILRPYGVQAKNEVE